MSKQTKTKIADLIQEVTASKNVTVAMSSIDIQHITKTVDFGANATRSEPNVKYTINVSSTFPRERDGLLCFFPTHHDEKQQILKSDSYGGILFGKSVADMNKEINRRLRETSQNHPNDFDRVRLGVGYGDHIFRCRDLEGTIYVLWATINRKNVGNVKNTILDCPILFNMDGWGIPKGIFLLKQTVQHENDLYLLPLKRGNPEFMWPKEPIFVCEKRPRHIKPKKLHFISKQLAQQLIQSPSKEASTWVHFEQNPFQGTVNKLKGNPEADALVVMEPLSEAEWTDEGLSWSDTPRDVLFEEATPRTQESMGSSSLLVHVPRIEFMTPSAGLLNVSPHLYTKRDPFEPDDPEEVQRTRDQEEELRVEEVVLMGGGIGP